MGNACCMQTTAKLGLDDGEDCELGNLVVRQTKRRSDEEIAEAAHARLREENVNDQDEQFQHLYSVYYRNELEDEAIFELTQMGINDRWLVGGFLEAFDTDENGTLDRGELDEMLRHLRVLNDKNKKKKKTEEIPADIKATMALNDRVEDETLTVREHDTFSLPKNANVQQAFYGDPQRKKGKAVTEKVHELLRQGGTFQVSSEHFGDPVGVMQKVLFVDICVTQERCVTPGNPKLKMILTSAGFMPGTDKTKIEVFKALKATCPGKGVLYLVDARMAKLQYHVMTANPLKHNDEQYVAYRRVPDEPGGEPQLDAEGKPQLKNEEELANTGPYGFAGVPWMLRNRGHYSNGDLEILTENEEGTPIYVSYLWYTGEVDDNGNFIHDILLAKGVYKGGKFCALHPDGREFSEEEYNIPRSYDSRGDDWFQIVDRATFEKLFDEVQVVFGCGGSPYMCILHFQPDFIDETRKHKSKPNPYGASLIGGLKAGKVVYVSMSAGSMCWNWTMGPMTTSRERFLLTAVDKEGDDDDHIVQVDLSRRGELRRLWLFPGLGRYIGVPYDLSTKVHVHFDPATCKYDGTGHKCQKSSSVVSAMTHQTKYCMLLADYDWALGSGDALELSNGKAFFLAGFCDKAEGVDERIGKKLVSKHGLKDKRLPYQPPGVPPEGLRFEWVPADGEIICAGPKANQVTFRMYADNTGPLKDAHPSYSTSESRLDLGADVSKKIEV